MNKVLLRALMISYSLVIFGCTLYNKPEVPTLTLPEHFKYEVKVNNEKLKNEWWENFNDETLNNLVCLAVKNNYNYQIALINIEIARTYIAQNMSGLFPQVNANLNVSRNKTPKFFLNNFGSGNATTAAQGFSINQLYNLSDLAFTTTYEIDFWNQIRNSVKQAKADVKVSEANSNVIKLTLISTIVDTYFQIKAIKTNLINLNEQYQCVKEIIAIIQAQFSGGLIDSSTLNDAKNQAEVIKNNILSLEKQKQILLITLAYLLGEYPENFKIEINDKIQNYHYTELVPPGIPCYMLANRPDIKSAYYQILSSGYVVKQNIANFLPSFSLTGEYGFASSQLGKLIRGSNAYWNYALNISQFVFDYAIRESEYKRSKYAYDSAILSYKNAVINAFNEVDTALISYKQDSESLIAYQKQLDNAKANVKLANAQFQSGLADDSIYLNDNLIYLQLHYELTNQQLLVIEDILQIYKSLGLGL